MSIAQFLIDGNNITLATDGIPIAAYIVGYITKDLPKKFESCCNIFLVGDLDEGNEDLDYQELLWRVGSLIPSTNLIT